MSGSLKDLSLKISYKSKGTDDIVNTFLVPALKCARIYKRSVGFFSSSVFELTGDAIEEMINNDGEIRIICSPELSEKDIESIKLGYTLKNAKLREIFESDVDQALEFIETKQLTLLSKLIRDGKLNISVVGVKDQQDSVGIYHDKIGIIEDSEGNKVLFVGSANESKNAYLYNYEKIRLSMSWIDGDLHRIEDDEAEFDSIWNGENEFVERFQCSDIVAKKIDNVLKVRQEEPDPNDFKLRDYQEKAISKWVENNYRGFYVMATGTGKTWTAIYSSKEVTGKESVFLVICAPYKHLIKQWQEDVKKVYPDSPIILISSENASWQEELADAILSSKYGEKKTVIAISTIKSFCSSKFDKIANKTNLQRMLIVDEAHRFKNLSEQIKSKYKYMLGLSATPASRKNDEFANQLVDFFGGKVYDLPIEFAIDKGYLVKYNYHPIYVNASQEDENKFNKYTRLMSSCFRNGVCVDVENLAKHKRSRLRVISLASEKNEKIEWILSQVKEKDHFIIYCGDGKLYESGTELRHIQYIKNILDSQGFKTAQFTADENMNDRMKIVDSFNRGMIDAMVAIRCLDEGINIPSIQGALLLSSNDDYREFVQRRGRILRKFYSKYSETEKEVANIYDVIVLPSDGNSTFAAIELRRFYEYARLAKNSDECLAELDDLLIRYGIDKEEFEEAEDMEGDLDE